MLRRGWWSLCPLLLVAACTTAQDGSAAQISQVASDDQLSREAMIAHIRSSLDGNVVGYAFYIGGDEPLMGGGGLARTSADGSEIVFTAETPMISASISKWITAMAAMRILDQQGIPLNSAIGPHLPNGWVFSEPVGAMTFAQLLRQTSGVKAPGRGVLTYERLEEFFSQPVDPDEAISCGADPEKPGSSGIAVSDNDFCYTNYNTSLLGTILAAIEGRNDGVELSPGEYPARIEQLLQDNVFSPANISDATCAPNKQSYALSYFFGGHAPGKDWADSRAPDCAAGGVYISVKSLGEILESISNKDGKILREVPEYSSFREMREQRLGLDRSWPHLIEKGGLLGDDAGVLSTTAIIFDPDDTHPTPAVLFINSLGEDETFIGARQILEEAYQAAKEKTD